MSKAAAPAQTTGTPTAPPAKRQKTSSSSSSSAVAAIFSSTRSINRVPVEVWKEHICQKFLNLTELSILRRSHTFFQKYWQNVMAQNVIRVPRNCAKNKTFFRWSSDAWRVVQWRNCFWKRTFLRKLKRGVTRCEQNLPKVASKIDRMPRNGFDK